MAAARGAQGSALAEPGGEELLTRLAEHGDFPAVSRFLTEVLAASRSDQVSTQRLATLILRDFSLTNAILRMVNSAYYRSAAEQQISTISRAILLLGVDTVTNIAVGLTVFERLRDDSDMRGLKGLTVVSLLTGFYARELAGVMRDLEPEEAFICGMMCELGRLAVAHQLPDRYRAIQRAVAEDHTDETIAARVVLDGLDFTHIGRALAERWNLPRQVQATIGPRDDAPASPPDPLRRAIGCARELATIATIPTEHDRQLHLEALAKRYGDHLPVDRGLLEKLLANSSDRLEALSHALRISRRDIEQVTPALVSGIHPAPGDPALAAAVPSPKAPPARAELFLTALAEIGYAISADYALNDVFMMILEGMYRVVGFEHVLLALVTPDRSALRGRFGLGEGTAQAVASFAVPLQPAKTQVARAIAAGQQLLIQDTADGAHTTGLPTEFVTLLRPRTFLLAPLVIRGSVIGAFYVDRATARQPIGDLDLRDLRVLVNQAVLAVRQTRSS